jgi:hypothetical protein
MLGARSFIRGRDSSRGDRKRRLGGAGALAVVAAAVAAGAAGASSDADTVRIVSQRKVARAGSTRAVLLYTKLIYRGGIFKLANPRVRISREGARLFAEAAPVHPRGSRHGYEVQPGSFAARDLDGDGEPEVILELDWGGAHCCYWARVYRFSASRGTYVPANHWWGDAGAVPALRDVGGDGRPEFVSRDDRFAELVSAASVVRPIQLWSYRHGTFRDVTRSYPALVRRDAAHLWRLYLADRGRRSVRYVLAAWAAEQHVLGRGRAVDRALAQTLRRGDLAPRLEDRPRDPVAYVRMLKRFLRQTGYDRG